MGVRGRLEMALYESYPTTDSIGSTTYCKTEWSHWWSVPGFYKTSSIVHCVKINTASTIRTAVADSSLNFFKDPLVGSS